MMDVILNRVRLESQRVLNSSAKTRQGIVVGYDPDHYAVKVELQPDGARTGWIPLKSPWIGNGWGLYAAPSIGDVVEVSFHENDKEAPSAGLRLYNQSAKPLSCPSGEFWLVHSSGNFIKFQNDGVIRSHGLWLHDGDFRTTGDITDRYTTINQTVNAFREIYDIHTHGGIQVGSSDTQVPNQQI